jgi:hypothetical protein
MLDSSPIAISPPKKLKRTASAASLPSPPPSVEHLKKRTASQRFGTGTDSGGEDEVDEVTKESKVVGRKLLFPTAPLTSSGVDHTDNPFVDNYAPSDIKEPPAPVVESTQSVNHASAPASPPPSRRKITKAPTPSLQTPSSMEQRGRCSPFELPVLDEENNPFLVDGPPKSRRLRSPRDLTEQPTLTYVLYVHSLPHLICVV